MAGNFSITKQAGLARVGRLKIGKGVAKTPFFMPIATRGAVKGISALEVLNIGYEVVLGNTYHLWLKPGEKFIARAGGLSRLMNWPGLTLTDSGGFQVFSLGARSLKRFGQSKIKISEKGVRFTDPTTGKEYFMSPEKSIDIQLTLGSNIIMCLDECPPYPASYTEMEKAVKRTTDWARRCRNYFDRKIKENNLKDKVGRPLIFCIIQGGIYQDLREKSARELSAMDWDGFAIGGVAVGEPREKLQKIIEWTRPFLPENKPRYLMGLGRPEELVRAVRAGIDMFDCVIPTREGRHGRLFVFNRKKAKLDEKGEFYQAINISNKRFREDLSSLDTGCRCYFCQNHNLAYLHHLFSIGDSLAQRFASIHNLCFYYELIERLRMEIEKKFVKSLATEINFKG